MFSKSYITLLYAAWLKHTAQDKLRVEAWGPAWVLACCARVAATLRAALGVHGGIRIELSEEELEAIAPCVVTAVPHGTGLGFILHLGCAASPREELCVQRWCVQRWSS